MAIAWLVLPILPFYGSEQLRGLATQTRKQNIKLGTATKASCCAQSLLAEWSLACEPYTLTNIGPSSRMRDRGLGEGPVA